MFGPESTGYSNMSDSTPPPSPAGVLPATLAPELWALIARRALAADGDSVQAWLRLSLVSRTFRNALLGERTSSRLPEYGYIRRLLVMCVIRDKAVMFPVLGCRCWVIYSTTGGCQALFSLHDDLRLLRCRCMRTGRRQPVHMANYLLALA